MSYRRLLRSMHKINYSRTCVLLGMVSFFILSCQRQHSDQPEVVQIEDSDFVLTINTKSLQFKFENTKSHDSVPHAASSGLFLDGYPVVSAIIENDENLQKKELNVTSSNGDKALVTVNFSEGIARFTIVPETERLTNISLRLGGMPVAHGLGDAGSYGENFNLIENATDTYSIVNNGGTQRWVSTFVIFPRNELAGVFFDQGKKLVVINANEYQMNITKKGKATFYYFLGEPATIYKNYKKIREEKGYIDVKPKFGLFELGWESWDALGWNTNQHTVKNILQKFIDNKYPIKWAVTGSGFWETGGTTTSFGKWGEKFSATQGFKTWMHCNDIKWMIGLRTNFIPDGGPYYPVTKERDKNLKVNVFNGNDLSTEAREKGFLVKKSNGEPFKITSSIFPIVPSYLLDGNVSGAASWYRQQYLKWGVDGIKEDTMMDLDSLTNIFNAPVSEIAQNGGLVMARNGEFTAPGSLLRINDTRVSEISRRIPINYLQYAASGFPNVYSDVAGTHNMDNLEDVDSNIRHAWLLASTAGMSVGAYPDGWQEHQQGAFKKAIDFHYALAPYMYSAAIAGYQSGYPHILTPLSIAFLQDSIASRQENFEWMIGESILATPLLKNHELGKMDVYLPKGIWYDFENGKKYQGPVTLEDFDFPLDKIPVFIGGKGVLIERVEKKLIAKIYPILNRASVTFYGLDGETKSVISIVNPDWNTPKIIETETGAEVPFKKNAPTIEFDFMEGKNYTIK